MKKSKIPPLDSPANPQRIITALEMGVVLDRQGRVIHNFDDVLQQARQDEIDLWRKRLARTEWASAQIAKWRDAQDRLNKAWSKQIGAHQESCPHVDDEGFCQCELPDPPEHAEVEREMESIRNVIDHDRWPRHLHWSL